LFRACSVNEESESNKSIGVFIFTLNIKASQMSGLYKKNFNKLLIKNVEYKSEPVLLDPVSKITIWI